MDPRSAPSRATGSRRSSSQPTGRRLHQGIFVCLPGRCASGASPQRVIRSGARCTATEIRARWD
jgi:hypothetical protein